VIVWVVWVWFKCFRVDPFDYNLSVHMLCYVSDLIFSLVDVMDFMEPASCRALNRDGDLSLMAFRDSTRSDLYSVTDIFHRSPCSPSRVIKEALSSSFFDSSVFICSLIDLYCVASLSSLFIF